MVTAPERPQNRTMLFGDLVISYDANVLEPRPWTEQQASWALEVAADAPPGPILELCTGAGQIGLLAAVESGRDLVAVDLSAPACRFAAVNAERAGIAGRVEIRHLPLDEAVSPDEVFPVVIADPPWVPAAQTGRFPEDPLTAIDGGDDGLDVARACLDVIAAHLHRDGVAVLQVGTIGQVDALRTALPTPLRVGEVREVGDRGTLVLLRHGPSGDR